MKYKCVNELSKFGFQEAGLISCDYKEGTMNLTFEGVIAMYDNPHNQKFEDCYISATQMRLKNASIVKFFLEGAKYYDANDVLLEEVPDRDIMPEACMETIEKLSNSAVFMLREKNTDQEETKCCIMAVDVEEDTYWMEIQYEKAVIEWERFMNKVQP